MQICGISSYEVVITSRTVIEIMPLTIHRILILRVLYVVMGTIRTSLKMRSSTFFASMCAVCLAAIKII